MLPDFYVAGFPKCGTTTICDWLSQHPDVCSPTRKEPHIFSFDDVQVNEFSFFESPSSFDHFDISKEIAHYKTVFSTKKNNQLCFDGTPSYAMSEQARKRIKHYTPDAKIIFILRHPTSRAISQYWHAVRHRRASFSFFKHLRYESIAPLTFSFYMAYLPKWYDDFPFDNILILTLDEVIQSPPKVIEKVSTFLNIPLWKPELKVKNQRVAFFSIRLQLLLNFIPKIWNADYNAIPGWDEPHSNKKGNSVKTVATKIIRKLGDWNMGLGRKPPPTHAHLSERLDLLFEKENKGLSALTGIDFEKIWKMKI